ncbi:MAG: 50S ribosomal protein L22 [Burkholderiaceae bacterium]|nr:50S ribosomal protein L22 [Burkholderiaceae bacterium]
MKASVRNIRISPKKLNVIAYIVRNMTAKDALDTLRFMPKKGASIIYDVIKSAVHNAAHNDNQSVEGLRIASISVSQGLVHRRINPISRGRAHRILKRTSHVDLTLSA